MKNIFWVFCLMCVWVRGITQVDTLDVAGEDSVDLSEMSIEELSQLKSRYKKTEMEQMVTQAIIAASRKPLSLKRSPSIVSVVTSDDIEKSGARDIMDVLRLVPGIDFNVDVQGVVGISFRGLWANEGKVLLLLDGQEMNEIAYSAIVLGNNYNISQIKKIEVIRGPGSAIYGGFAEYAVINIITKNAEELNGIQYDVIIGQAINTYARQNMSISVGKRIKDWGFSLSTFIGRGQRSNSIYTDIYGSSYDMEKNSNLNPTNLNIGLTYKNLSVRLMYDMLALDTRDAFIEAMSKPYTSNFSQYFAEVKYTKKLNDRWQLQGRFNYKRSSPWEFTGISDSIDGYPSYRILADRYRLNLGTIWDPTYWLNITVGAETYYDNAVKPLLNGDVQLFTKDSINHVAYNNYAGFVQSLIKSRFANITIGARYDLNSASGAAFSPRLGITKRIKKFNFKLLYASSYRAPGIENIQLSIDGNILPEKSRTLELETGFQIDRNMYLSVSLYDITTQNAIRYVIDTTIITLDDAPEGYINSRMKIGTQGLDIEYKYKSSFGSINLSYAYYGAGNKNIDPANAVSINPNANLGISNHKFTGLFCLNMGDYFYFSPSAVFLGKRYGYTSVDTLGNGILSTYKPNLQLNVYFGFTNVVKGLSFGVGVYNVTNREIFYIQPYNGLHAEYPGMGTEFILKLKYDFNFVETE